MRLQQQSFSIQPWEVWYIAFISGNTLWRIDTGFLKQIQREIRVMQRADMVSAKEPFKEFELLRLQVKTSKAQ